MFQFEWRSTLSHGTPIHIGILQEKALQLPTRLPDNVSMAAGETMPTKPQANKQTLINHRVALLNTLDAATDALERHKETTKEARGQLTQLESVSTGIYDEIDKLTKKSP